MYVGTITICILIDIGIRIKLLCHIRINAMILMDAALFSCSARDAARSANEVVASEGDTHPLQPAVYQAAQSF